MNRDAPSHESPELSDEDVKLLHQICKRATRAADPPFKALFHAYDRVFAEEQIEPAHDGVVFRLLMRVGEAARGTQTPGAGAEYVSVLRDLLEAQGIMIVDDDDDQEYDETIPSVEQALNGHVDERRRLQDRRRVSFDDAHLEEVWLDGQEPSGGLDGLDSSPLRLLSQRPRRSIERPAAYGKRSNSADAMLRHDPTSTSALVEAGSVYSLSAQGSEGEGNDEFPRPTYEELEDNADAFFETSQLRATRTLLLRWHNLAVSVRTFDKQSTVIATAHDYCTLLRQAFDIWREKSTILQQQRLEEERVDHEYRLRLLRKWFGSWLRSTEAQRSAVAVAKTILLKVRYFKRWRSLAIENAARVRHAIASRAWRRWRAITLQHLDQQKVAEAHLKRALVKRCYSAWFWRFCHHRVDGWHEDRVLESIFARLGEVGSLCASQHQQADEWYNSAIQRRALRLLHERATSTSDDIRKATGSRQGTIKRQCLDRWTTLTKLKRPAIALDALISGNAKRCVMGILVSRHRASLQASDFARQRLLKTTCRAWNDALRHRALTSRIDERVMAENLYRWVLQGRVALFKRSRIEDTKRLHFDYWRECAQVQQAALRDAADAFLCRQERRRKTFGMLQLNHAVRRREDACRAAIELDNRRILPRVIQPWVSSARTIISHEKWAADASYYFTATRVLNIWKTKTRDHQQRRKRDAYAQIRTRVKTRTARICFGQLRDKFQAIRMLAVESNARVEAKNVMACGSALNVLKELQGIRTTREQIALHFDRHRLQVAGLSAISAKREDITTLELQAQEVHHESEMDVVARLVKIMQWHHFTAARRVETAEALAARYRDSHVRQMIRHWSLRTRDRRESKAPLMEPDSPSLRPASRAASRRSQQREIEDIHSAPLGTVLGTPAYLRTPSRSRRAARFRSLPTPAAITPFVFDPKYLITVPAALPHNTTTDAQVPNRPSSAEYDGVLVPQVTPFARKLMARGIVTTPAPALRSSVFGRAAPGTEGTTKSVRFARPRFAIVDSSSPGT